MPRRSAPSRTPSTTSTSTPPRPARVRGSVSAAAVSSRTASASTVGDPELLHQALVHSSYLHEHPDAAPTHNERLEFLGDAVVNLAISEALYAAPSRRRRGRSCRARRAAIVSTAGLARSPRRIELGDDLLLGEGEATRGGRRRPSLLASAFEASAGALYLDLARARATGSLALAAPELGGPTRRSRASRAPRAGSRSSPSGRPASGPSTASWTRRGPTTRRPSGRGRRRRARPSAGAAGRRAASPRPRPPSRRSRRCSAEDASRAVARPAPAEPADLAVRRRR